jgi:outer membrane biosynthesis protein TonB
MKIPAKLIAMLALLTTACTGTFPTAQAELPAALPALATVAVDAPSPAAPTADTASAAPPADIPTDPPPADIPTDPPPADIPTQAPPATIDPNLHATDPGTVSLASGRVQLVEFFAFW